MANTVRALPVVRLIASSLSKLTFEAVNRILENSNKLSDACVIPVYAILQELDASSFNHATFRVIVTALLTALKLSGATYEAKQLRVNKNRFPKQEDIQKMREAAGQRLVSGCSVNIL